MKFVVVFVCVVSIQNGLADIIESFKEDIFTIYREAAVLIRDVHGRNVTPEDVTFFLFTRETPEDSIELNPNNLITLANKNVKIVFFVHGWSNSRKVAWYESLKNAFLRRDDEYYVVQVDWRTPAQEIYPIAAISSYDVATYIEQVIEDLHKKHDIPLDNILLVGHSIGAHIVGFVGEKVYKSIGEKLPRIIALDPAGPFFSQRPADKRLNEGHAEVVEVLHTDGGLFGMLTPCGTIDFFANGGRDQPGCIRIDLTDFSSIKESGVADVIEGLKDDIFHIYKNTALTVRDDVQGRNVTPDDVNFFLFTRENPEEYVRLDPNNLDRLANKNVKIVFFVHGWTNSREVEWYEDLKNAFLHRDEEYYVVQVDWKDPADQIYAVASISTYDVARYIRQLIEDLNKKHDIPLDNILLVGHSLGGQIVGFMGKQIFKSLGKKLPRVIALDPAGPFFKTRPLDKRLNKDDAEVVEVLHTDGGTFGFSEPCGTIDFFPNGGKTQPGCKQIDLADFSSIPEPVWCDHRRAYSYFVEAILNPREFVAKKCSSWNMYKINYCDKEEVALGDISTNLTGNFYLETNKEKPYSKRPSGQSAFSSVSKLFRKL